MRVSSSKECTGTVNHHPSEGTHWTTYDTENGFDSNGYPPPNLISQK